MKRRSGKKRSEEETPKASGVRRAEERLVQSATGAVHAVQAAGREIFGVLGLHRKRGKRTAGLAPGTVVVDDDAADLQVTWIRYGKDFLDEHTVDAAAPMAPQLEPALGDPSDPSEKADPSDPSEKGARAGSRSPVTWIRVTGLGDAERLVELGRILGLHPLTLEDIANLDQRPKSEVFGDDRLLFLRGCDEQVSDEMPLRTWQEAVLLRPGLVITFAEGPSDLFEPVLGRIRQGNPRIRSLGADYLAYALLDAVVDRYLLVLDSFRDLLDAMEETILDESVDLDLQRLHRVRRDLLRLQRLVPPVAPILAELASPPAHLSPDEAGPVFDRQVRVFLRDCQDHALRAADLVGAFRDLAGDLLDLHLSVVGYRTNEVMKVLTMIATLFIPLSFLAGLYGMNFDTSSPWNLPELGWRYGYPALLSVMGVVAVALLVYFRRKGWF